MEPVVHEFYSQLKQGRILGRRCEACGHFQFPPQGLCSGCGGADLAWAPVSGRGTLLFASVGEHRMMGLRFIQGTVELEEGPLVSGMTILPDFDLARPEGIWGYNRAGLPVVAEVVKNPQGTEAVAFRVVRAEGPGALSEAN